MSAERTSASAELSSVFIGLSSVLLASEFFSYYTDSSTLRSTLPPPAPRGASPFVEIPECRRAAKRCCSSRSSLCRRDPGLTVDYARMRWGFFLLVLRREYGNIFYRGARGIIFPYSLQVSQWSLVARIQDLTFRFLWGSRMSIA